MSFHIPKIRELRTYLTEKYLICIAGNKNDLSDKRVVHSDYAKKYADSVGATFIETSAKNSQNINELFVNGKTLTNTCQYRDSFYILSIYQP